MIARLTREIEEIDEYFYASNKNDDPVLYAGMLERKRDDIIRGVVSQLHTAIEDILNGIIVCRVLNVQLDQNRRKTRGRSAQALRKVLFGAGSVGFEMKLNLAVALRLLDTRTKAKLVELNALRNRCSHNWLLKATVRRGRRPQQKKPPLLSFRSRDLHRVTVFKEFSDEYGRLYVRLFAKYIT